MRDGNGSAAGDDNSAFNLIKHIMSIFRLDKATFRKEVGITKREYRYLEENRVDKDRDETWLKVIDWVNTKTALCLAVKSRLDIVTEKARDRRRKINIYEKRW